MHTMHRVLVQHPRCWNGRQRLLQQAQAPFAPDMCHVSPQTAAMRCCGKALPALSRDLGVPWLLRGWPGRAEPGAHDSAACTPEKDGHLHHVNCCLHGLCASGISKRSAGVTEYVISNLGKASMPLRISKQGFVLALRR